MGMSPGSVVATAQQKVIMSGSRYGGRPRGADPHALRPGAGRRLAWRFRRDSGRASLPDKRIHPYLLLRRDPFHCLARAGNRDGVTLPSGQGRRNLRWPRFPEALTIKTKVI